MLNTHPINRLSKAGSALVNTISSIIIIMGQLKRMDARTYIHERWASRTWPANMFKLYICTHKKKNKK